MNQPCEKLWMSAESEANFCQLPSARLPWSCWQPSAFTWVWLTSTRCIFILMKYLDRLSTLSQGEAGHFSVRISSWWFMMYINKMSYLIKTRWDNGNETARSWSVLSAAQGWSSPSSPCSPCIRPSEKSVEGGVEASWSSPTSISSTSSPYSTSSASSTSSTSSTSASSTIWRGWAGRASGALPTPRSPRSVPSGSSSSRKRRSSEAFGGSNPKALMVICIFASMTNLGRLNLGNLGNRKWICADLFGGEKGCIVQTCENGKLFSHPADLLKSNEHQNQMFCLQDLPNILGVSLSFRKSSPTSHWNIHLAQSLADLLAVGKLCLAMDWIDQWWDAMILYQWYIYI